MRTAPPQRCCTWQEDGGPALVLPGRPWAVRLAGRDPAFGALEVYEADVLLDVVTSTRLALLLLRLTSWCWLAVADGRFDRVAVRSGDACVRSRIRQGRP